jgi:hypothetical protein
VQGLGRGDVSVPHPHPDRRKINEESIDAAVQEPADFGLEIAMRRRRIPDLQIVGQKFILGTESPHVDLEIHGVCRADTFGTGQMLGDADRIGVCRDVAQVSQLVFQ